MIKPQPDDEIATFNETLDLALAAWSQGIGNHDDAAELKALFATERAARVAAEAERDRLREALQGLVNALEISPGPRGVLDLVPDALKTARAALAGEEGGNG